MKKLLITSCLAAVLATGIAQAGMVPYTKSQKDALTLLQTNGYHDVTIQGQTPSKCSVAKNDFDWEMQLFQAVSKDGHIITGFVCNGNIYLRTTTVDVK